MAEKTVEKYKDHPLPWFLNVLMISFAGYSFNAIAAEYTTFSSDLAILLLSICLGVWWSFDKNVSYYRVVIDEYGRLKSASSGNTAQTITRKLQQNDGELPHKPKPQNVVHKAINVSLKELLDALNRTTMKRAPAGARSSGLNAAAFILELTGFHIEMPGGSSLINTKSGKLEYEISFEAKRRHFRMWDIKDTHPTSWMTLHT